MLHQHIIHPLIEFSTKTCLQFRDTGSGTGLLLEDIFIFENKLQSFLSLFCFVCVKMKLEHTLMQQ